MRETKRFVLAKSLADWAKRVALELGMSPEQIRKMTVRDIRRFYSKEVEMPKVRKYGGLIPTS